MIDWLIHWNWLDDWVVVAPLIIVAVVILCHGLRSGNARREVRRTLRRFGL